jgi:dephospho-CoA kinase
MIKVGITGSIGSGKTLVCDIFKQLGVPVFNADKEAKMIFGETEIVRQMTERFGEEIYVDKGMIDRKLLASKLFGNQPAIDFVNGLVHPAVRMKFEKWSANVADADYLLYEAAIIFETGYYKQLNATILVTAPEKLRLKRVTERDQVDEEAVMKRMEHQWPDEKKIPLADYVINNDGNNHLIPQVLAIHEQILALP